MNFRERWKDDFPADYLGSLLDKNKPEYIILG